METTFISIHDLTDNATILYSSDSVVDILGYTPDEIVNRSAWEFFSLDELPFAKDFYQKRVATDKAAVLGYCRVKDSHGNYVGCECCFTIVYDVMVVCTSIYRRGLQADKRAAEAPVVRRMFSSSPKDPRYHMLSHLSTKFSQASKNQDHEPRAALFLNRFTRTLTIMYATSGLQDVIGIPAETMRGRSFYYCISENCLPDAVKCLENAKGNDSIAYLRFWFRDPRIDDDDPAVTESEDSDEEMTTDTSVDGGVNLGGEPTSPGAAMDIDSDESKYGSRHSSGDSTRGPDTHEAIFGEARRAESSTSSLAASPERGRNSPTRAQEDHIELEAVISCTSDGLVVCLRKARPMIPHPTQRPARPVYERGLFAAPWASEPVLPPLETRGAAGFGSSFAPSLGPHGARRSSNVATAHGNGKAPEQSDFMNAIREQAIFAWALTGINGSLAEYGQGRPSGESLPHDGLPVWASDPRYASDSDRGSSDYRSGSDLPEPNKIDGRSAGPHIFGDPGLGRNSNHSSLGVGSGTNSANHSSNGTPYTGPR
ncbi:hypothetical protein CLAFUW4_07872 [Fulvia fulva]|uniref:PAS domain-containing protein n=1 Tax=Passalora fulva TaxID=5499 RepID=A0A9Q8LCC8_PASFU|nr:uncharacterized protein CLAFUR5_07997 [Fulvia fulva]KAK4630520.1 hypothetical protein CLAFUR0_07874 [Fulvia fulva]UJO14823.1 hypothetical protein CLAFUR5_07997 [Fulvia fulva]WPV12703.1 hypothetical protein CLAFUW4_07872 [Fulvia fulva]WPV27648.1 hypothetical protein CLAFUW7_07873 [Fulvia fulva]